eukprot:5706243-Karenia_brevis.AAC.1
MFCHCSCLHARLQSRTAFVQCVLWQDSASLLGLRLPRSQYCLGQRPFDPLDCFFFRLYSRSCALPIA